MKALKTIYAVIVGTLGGILGAAVFLLLIIANAIITLATASWQAFCQFLNSENSDPDNI
jgi:hypothetical protein